MVIDFGKPRSRLRSVQIEGVDTEVVGSHRYLGLVLDDKLDWSNNTDHLYRKDLV